MDPDNWFKNGKKNPKNMPDWLKILGSSPPPWVIAHSRENFSKQKYLMYIVYNTFSDSGGEICHFDMEYHFSWVYTEVQVQMVSNSFL